ncbi:MULTISPECIES: SDR family NAD(P)-dependent oxidoreductase [unclassified Streptomyces]|uniref:SDR family NAD(P)-dependent oxidoreductase n=1 Tax=unclassified Streptomyces TaxID=2593676 RepID=UPI000748448B|nr:MULTISPECIES: SDR family NAD(P)-dependent oxidoreductase [unclassified Streptomyces]KUL78247.1 3-oxoacyl-ACP reductase [Streptomyces sp. NRRL WC-3605]KUL79425.1 3-oxoacyl-ACP reductase [Streptomyces sp. NRRL WC-3604]
MSTLLLTGATSGLGRHLAVELVRAGHRVLAHGRDARRTERLVEELRADGEAEGYVADLASLGQVRELAAHVAGDHPELDVLINNAAVGGGPDRTRRELSADGHELRLAVNYLAPVVLTRELLPVLRANAPARIVNVGSAGQEPLDPGDPEMTRGYEGVAAYCRSKFALAVHTFALAEELAGTGVSVNVVHPATHMDTAMVRDSGLTPLHTVADGAPGVLALATRDLGSGGYFDGTSPARAHPAAYDPATRERLTAVTEQLLSL